MKIIKKGKKLKPNVYRQVCPHCGCIFEYNDSDTYADYIDTLKQIEEIGYVDESKNNKVNCPCCRKEIIIKDI